MFTPYSLIPATNATPNTLGNLASGTNTAPFAGQVLGAGQVPQPPAQQPSQPPATQLTTNSAAANNSTNTTQTLTTSQSGSANSNLASTTTQRTPTLSYVTAGNNALNMSTNASQVYDQLQQYYSPRGLGYTMAGAPSSQQLQSFANNLTNTAGGYQQSASTFGNLYADLVEGRISQDNYVSSLQRMQELSRQGTGQWNQVQQLMQSNVLPQPQQVAGMGMTQNTLGLAPAQRFLLPQETWDMNPQELLGWIQRHEKNASSMGFLDTALSAIGTGLIGGAIAGGITGISGISPINSVIGSGIENLTGMNSR
jgi:hypothetical protein